MAVPTPLMATWSDGVFVLSPDTIRHELAGHAVRGLKRDGRGSALAVVDGRTVRRRSADGAWHVIATATVDQSFSCCLPVGDRLYAGTDDARVVRVIDEGHWEPLAGFDRVDGRDRWYAGTAVVDGKVVGPPLGVRSMTATCDGAALLVNIHVGGIPRSADGGATWQPTIDVEVDVHQVSAHPTRPDLVAAAGGAGLCISRDAGATWTVEHDGLHAPHCSAVAFVGDDIFVAASQDPFAAQGAVYRRPIAGSGPLQPVGGGLPRWLVGVCDTDCIAVEGAFVVIADRSGNAYVSDDLGRTWACRPTGHDDPSACVLV